MAEIHVKESGGHVAGHHLASDPHAFVDAAPEGAGPMPLRSLDLISAAEAGCTPSSSDGSTGGCCS